MEVDRPLNQQAHALAQAFSQLAASQQASNAAVIEAALRLAVAAAVAVDEEEATLVRIVDLIEIAKEGRDAIRVPRH
jgi:hypothetical protein